MTRRSASCVTVRAKAWELATRMPRAGLGLVAPVLVSSVEATHAVDHRYLVLGYVRDGTGRPVPGREVRVVREKTGLSYRAKTEADGFYLVVVHLHDEDLGEALEVTAGLATVRIRARFDPRDAESHRGTRVDFRGDQAGEHLETFVETLARYLSQ